MNFKFSKKKKRFFSIFSLSFNLIKLYLIKSYYKNLYINFSSVPFNKKKGLKMYYPPNLKALQPSFYIAKCKCINFKLEFNINGAYQRNWITFFFLSLHLIYFLLINKDEENCGVKKKRKFDDLFLGTVQFNNIDVCL